MNGLELRGEGQRWMIVRCAYMSGIRATMQFVNDVVYTSEAEGLAALGELVRQQDAATQRQRWGRQAKRAALDTARRWDREW